MIRSILLVKSRELFIYHIIDRNTSVMVVVCVVLTAFFREGVSFAGECRWMDVSDSLGTIGFIHD